MNIVGPYGPNYDACQVRSWQECCDHAGNVNMIHPKMIDGQDIIGQHYPPTETELNSFVKKPEVLK